MDGKRSLLHLWPVLVLTSIAMLAVFYFIQIKLPEQRVATLLSLDANGVLHQALGRSSVERSTWERFFEVATEESHLAELSWMRIRHRLIVEAVERGFDSGQLSAQSLERVKLSCNHSLALESLQFHLLLLQSQGEVAAEIDIWKLNIEELDAVLTGLQ
jgi:hypothetical protein